MHRLLPLVAWKLDGKATYMFEGMMKTTGSALQWVKENLCLVDDVAQTADLAFSVPSTEGVYFVPAFTGLSSPYWDPHACGIVVGLCRKTTRAHIVRAALEGIVYRCTDVVRAMRADAGLPVRSVAADGGASKNEFLLQFMADMLDVPVERPAMLDGTALGAAFLAGLASGFWDSTDELQAIRTVDRVFRPDMAPERRAALYAGWQKAVSRSFKWERMKD
jgi:glycerol kinase